MQEGLNILIVEDEPMIAELLKKMVLLFGASHVWICPDDTCAFETAMREAVDLVFMDLNIRGSTDGIQCAHRITQYKEVNIVFATSFCDADVLEEAIDLNTLNYLVKPYGKKDVEITMNLARIAKKRRLNRGKEATPSVKPRYLTQEVVLDPAARLVHSPEGAINLSKKEFDLLLLLSENINNTVPTNTILSKVWQNRTIAGSTLRETMTRLRKKVPGVCINTVHGFGYRLDKTD